MVPDWFCDLLYDGGYSRFDGWRCLCCGNILDPVILKNRLATVMRGPALAVPVLEDDQNAPNALVQRPTVLTATAA